MADRQSWHLRAESLQLQLNQPQTIRWAMWLIPMLFGLLSLKLGQDYNWDLRNYHLYNAFAFLNGKTEIDLAPAQMQTYFNPTIDLLYYALVKAFPGQLVSFVMGALHGLNFILVLTIARELLPAERGIGMPLLLALAGMLGNSFISQVGNTTGDNLTALTVLGALALLLRYWPRIQDGHGVKELLLAGALIGAGVGLKLTVAIFALAMCAAMLALPLRAMWRLRAALTFGVGVATGMAVAGGHWYWKMWALFGNPVYPQFNKFFHSPLATPITVVDTRFLPHGLMEYLLWPLILTFKPIRVSEIAVADPVWLFLYVGGVALIAKIFLMRKPTHAVVSDAGAPNGRMRLAVSFFALSFVIWMFLFSIYRYLIPIELLSPLMLWLLVQALLPRAVAMKVIVLLLAIIVGSNFPRANWGYAHLASTSFKAAMPKFPNPSASIVFTVDYNAPMGWLLTLMPKELPVVGLGSNFPESLAFRQRVLSMARSSTGPLYAVFQKSGSTVDAVHSAASQARDRELLDLAVDVTSRYGLVLDPSDCTTHPAFIGEHADYFKLCRVRVAEASRLL